MRFLLQILIVNSFLISPCLAQEGSARTSTAFIAQINDSIKAEVFLRYDEEGEPDAYVCHINTPVCEHGLCKLLVIDVYWDLLGNFLKYEFPAGEALTKLDHVEFSREDHEQLQKILLDKGSILRDYPAEDLIDRRSQPASDKADAVSAATRVDVKDAVVSGAVYSTYVLWHIVNGPIASRIIDHSKPLLTEERVEKMFYSSNFFYQYFALNSIAAKDSLKYLDEVIHLVRNGVSYIPYFAIEKVPASAWAEETSQLLLLEHFKSADFELQNFMLSRIENVPLFPAALDQLISGMKGLRDSQMVKALRIVKKNEHRLSDTARRQLATLKNHPNKEVGREVREILN